MKKRPTYVKDYPGQSGRYYLRFSYCDSSGTSSRYEVKKWRGQELTTIEQCVDAYQGKIAEIEESLKPKHLVNDVWKEYMQDTCQGLKPSSLGKYRTFEEVYLPFLNNVDIKDLTPLQMRNFVQFLNNSDNSVATKNKHLSTMRSFIHYIIDYYDDVDRSIGKALLNPIRDNEVKSEEKKSKWIPEALFIKILDNLDCSIDSDFYYYCCLYTLYYCQLRIGELSALTRDDYVVDGDTAYFNINKDYYRSGGVDYIQNTKTKLGVRKVFLSEDNKTLIDNFITRQRASYWANIRLNGKETTSARLFHQEKPFITQQRLREVLHRICRQESDKSGIDIEKTYAVSLHTLRHSGITELHFKGVDSTDIAARAGHNVAVDEEIYTHSSLDRQKELAKKL